MNYATLIQQTLNALGVPSSIAKAIVKFETTQWKNKTTTNIIEHFGKMLIRWQADKRLTHITHGKLAILHYYLIYQAIHFGKYKQFRTFEDFLLPQINLINYLAEESYASGCHHIRCKHLTIWANLCKLNYRDPYYKAANYQNIAELIICSNDFLPVYQTLRDICPHHFPVEPSVLLMRCLMDYHKKRLTYCEDILEDLHYLKMNHSSSEDECSH
ncbi:hypothetical protein [Lentisphaera araneosa]|uniref:hypothetical protein n=1 Tax=Lentisphaera araneosa TaxID=256847 RepID=UPI0003151F3B|nr:hypothetical protein [Lentisphaera araneosa]